MKGAPKCQYIPLVSVLVICYKASLYKRFHDCKLILTMKKNSFLEPNRILEFSHMSIHSSIIFVENFIFILKKQS